MKDRIRQVMEAHHMTQQTFAQFVGINAGSLSGIFNNRTKPTLNTVEALKSKIPNLNVEWLMFGRGSMFESEQASSSTPQGEETKNSNDNVFDSGLSSPDLFSMPHGVTERQQSQPLQAGNVKTEIKYVERPQRQITEIRVYFDDLTYETFVPKKN
ncbi:MAG: helix-turn-helix domain-containing protein [Prevotella sp.]